MDQMDLNDDIFKFIRYIEKFEVNVGGDPSVLIWLDIAWTVIQSEEEKFLGQEKYWFKINGIDWREYTGFILNLFMSFEEALVSAIIRARYIPSYPLEFNRIQESLRVARKYVSSIDLNEYTSRPHEEINQVHVTGPYGEILEIHESFPPEVIGVEEFRNLHIEYIDKALALFESSPLDTNISKGDRPPKRSHKDQGGPEVQLTGRSIAKKYRGENNEKIRILFHDLMDQYSLNEDDAELFISAFTGNTIPKRIYWPHKFNADLGRLFAGLYELKLFAGKHSQRDWAGLSNLFVDESGKAHTNKVRNSTRSKEFGSKDDVLPRILNKLRGIVE